jgi:hypothetical protein
MDQHPLPRETRRNVETAPIGAGMDAAHAFDFL